MTFLRVIFVCTLSVGGVLAQVGGFGGPSVLSRGGGAPGRGGGRPLAFRGYASVFGTYDTALTSAGTDRLGNLENFDAYGLTAVVGAYGYRSGQHDTVSLDYRGTYRHYVNRTSFNGSDHFLNLGYSNQVSRRVTFFLSQGAGTYSRALGVFSFPLASDPLSTIADPANDIFDTRTYALISQGGLEFQKSVRLAFSMNGGAFLVRRRAAALADGEGYQATGRISYGLSRRQWIGVNYGYSKFLFSESFGAADVHFAALDYSQRFSRLWTFDVGAGSYRAESKRLVRVTLDPVIAAILGQGTSLEAFHGYRYGSVIQANLRGDFRRSSLSFFYRRGFVPGNGFILTAQGETAGVGYSYTGPRRWNVGFNGSYTKYSAFTQNIGKYETYGGGAGFNYRITSYLHFTARSDFRRGVLENSTFARDRLQAAVGLSFSPGEIPLSLW